MSTKCTEYSISNCVKAISTRKEIISVYIKWFLNSYFIALAVGRLIFAVSRKNDEMIIQVNMHDDATKQIVNYVNGNSM